MKRIFEEVTLSLNDHEKHFLIDLVEKRPALWNELESNYKNLHVRAMAWRLVSEEMSEKFGRQYDSKLLQKCSKNLRDTYVRKRREYEDVLRKRTGLESGILEKITSWPFFANLRFIDPPDDDEGIRYCNVESEEIVEVVEEVDSIEPKRKFVQKRECAIAISKPKTALVPSSKKLERKTKGKDTVDKITSVLENLETPDMFESTGQALSAKLHEIYRLDKLTAKEYLIKLDEIQVQMSRSIYDLERARPE